MHTFKISSIAVTPRIREEIRCSYTNTVVQLLGLYDKTSDIQHMTNHELAV